MMNKSLIIFVSLSVIASGLNYLVYPLFSRILSPAEYVNITVALSLFTQISTFLSSILAITIGLSKDSPEKGVNKKIELLQAFLFKLFIVLAAIFLILSPIIMTALHTPVLFAVPIVLMMFFSIPILIISGYLNGRNEIIKLGAVGLISALSQFTIGLTVATVSHNGFLSMMSMIAAQFLTLAVIYAIFSKDKLPGVIGPLMTPIKKLRNERMGPLLLYTALSSLAVMAISLVQIADLFIAQTLTKVDIKFYADVYIISRVVFFGGMIFIWPFLAEISLDHHHLNRKPFLKLIAYLSIIAAVTMIAIFFFGDMIANIFFGSDYGIDIIRSTAILSVLYKYFLLIITAIILYFIVLRSYKAVWIAAIAAALILGYGEILNKASSIPMLLIVLDAIAAILAIISIVLLFRSPIKNIK